MGLLVIQDLLESKVTNQQDLEVFKVLQDLQVLLDHRVQLVTKVQLDQLVHKVHKDPQVLQVHKDQEVIKVHKEELDLQDHKGYKEIKDQWVQ